MVPPYPPPQPDPRKISKQQTYGVCVLQYTAGVVPHARIHVTVELPPTRSTRLFGRPGSNKVWIFRATRETEANMDTTVT